MGQRIPPFHARHGLTAAEYQSDFASFRRQGYRIQSLSIYGGSNPRYAAVWVKRRGPAWQACYGRNATDYQAFFNEWTGRGYVPRIVSATGSGSSAVFAAVFEKATVNGAWFAKHDLDQTGFDQANANAKANGQILATVGIYGSPNARKYAGVWMPNPGNVQWLVYLATDGTDYQAWFNAVTQIPLRPSIVVPTEDHAYLAVFRDDSIGAWHARHGMNSADYQTAFDRLVAQGDMPLDVHGGGTGSGTVYAALFAKQVDPSARIWTVRGASAPHAAALDTLFKDFMRRWGVRAAALGIAKNGAIKLTRAYTWAEPGYAITQTASEFRLASVSKAFTCAAIKTQANAGQLSLDAQVYPLLGITTPALASQTPDPRINDITVQNLVDHAGGWLPDSPGGFHPEFQLRKISADLHLPGPPSKRDLARYMYGMPLQFTPGSQNYDTSHGATYSNFGYILLGLVVEHVSGQAYTDYIRRHVLASLHITDVHLARTLASQRAANEVHYHSCGIGLPANLPSSLVQEPWAYGGAGFMTETMDSAGGLMATAATLAHFSGTWASWGLGGPGGARTGGMAGTATRMQFSGSGVSFGFVFNSSDSFGAIPPGGSDNYIDLFGKQVATAIARLTW